uniref:Uncharacterized protein n=1 Tax=Zea mays TaxID=4577 RepID=A0A804LH72_MAIZE
MGLFDHVSQLAHTNHVAGAGDGGDGRGVAANEVGHLRGELRGAVGLEQLHGVVPGAVEPGLHGHPGLVQSPDQRPRPVPRRVPAPAEHEAGREPPQARGAHAGEHGLRVAVLVVPVRAHWQRQLPEQVVRRQRQHAVVHRGRLRGRPRGAAQVRLVQDHPAQLHAGVRRRQRGAERDGGPVVAAHHEHRPAGGGVRARPQDGVGGVLERRGEAVLGRQAVVHGRHDRRGGGGQRRARVVERRGGRAEQDVAAAVEVDDQRQPPAVVAAGPGRHEEAEARAGGVVERDVAGVDHNAARPLLVLHRHRLPGRRRGEERRFPVAAERAVRVQADLEVLIRVHCAHRCTARHGRDLPRSVARQDTRDKCV